MARVDGAIKPNSLEFRNSHTFLQKIPYVKIVTISHDAP